MIACLRQARVALDADGAKLSLGVFAIDRLRLFTIAWLAHC